MFFFRVYKKEAAALTLLILEFIFDQMVASKKDNPFCPIFVFRQCHLRPQAITAE